MASDGPLSFEERKFEKMNNFAKKILCLLLVVLLATPVTAFAAGGTFGISASSSSVDAGSTFTVYVGGSCCGRVNLSVSNGTLSETKIWVEDGTTPVTVTAGQSGSVTVTATPTEGFSDLDAEIYSPGSRSVTVNIIKEEVKEEPKEEEDKKDESDKEETFKPVTPVTPVTPVEPEKPEPVYTVDDVEDEVYTGEKITPEVTVKLDGELLDKDDYVVTYKDNVDVGTAKVTVEGKGEHDFTITKNFEITAKDISKFTVENIEEQRFTGKELTPEVVVKHGDKVLENGVDYKVTYKNNIAIGTADIEIEGIGNYKGTLSTTFEITDTMISSDCSIHWMILLITAIGTAVTYAARKKKAAVLGVFVAVAAINAVLAATKGSCEFDWIMTIIGLALLNIENFALSGAENGEETEI